jgi:hypothetical protein
MPSTAQFLIIFTAFKMVSTSTPPIQNLKLEALTEEIYEVQSSISENNPSFFWGAGGIQGTCSPMLCPGKTCCRQMRGPGCCGNDANFICCNSGTTCCPMGSSCCSLTTCCIYARSYCSAGRCVPIYKGPKNGSLSQACRFTMSHFLPILLVTVTTLLTTAWTNK